MNRTENEDELKRRKYLLRLTMLQITGYGMGDIELLTGKVETSHWKKEEIYLQVFLLQAKDVTARENA